MKKLYKASILTGLFWCFTIQAQTYSITEDSFSITQRDLCKTSDFLKSGKKIGDVTGYYGYRTSGLHPNHVTMLGYPANFDSGNWMHRVDSQSFQSTFFNTTEYGSDMENGSSGGPWLENFGLKSVGQSALPNGMNYVVGVTSYGSTSSGPKYAGSSTLDTQFTNSSKTGIIDVACARSTGNC